MQKFINENPKSPNISFWTINVMDKPFRTHIDGRADVNIFKVLSNLKKLFTW